jgi:hypothetical protein
MEWMKPRQAPHTRWTQEMDDKLNDLVKKIGQHWSAIVPYFPGRNARQLRDHWRIWGYWSQLPFSNEEDRRILELGTIYAGHWKLMADVIGCKRSPMQIRNRYSSLIRGLEGDRGESAPPPLVPPLETFPIEEVMSDGEFHFDFSS